MAPKQDQIEEYNAILVVFVWLTHVNMQRTSRHFSSTGPCSSTALGVNEVAHTRRRSQSRRRSRFDEWSMAQYRIFIIYGRDLSARQGIIKANAPLGLSVTEWPEPPLNFDLVGDAGMHHRLCRK